MPRSAFARLVACSVALSLVLVAASSASAQAVTRRVFVTVSDGNNQPVAGLTPADFVVKEGGRDREIASVEPARTKMRLVLAIEEALGASGPTRLAAVEFLKQILPHAEVSLVLVGLSTKTMVPFTSDMNALVTGINALPASASRQTAQVPESVYELARAFTRDKERAERPVLVMIALDLAQESLDQPSSILNMLRDSGAQFNVLSLATGRASRSSATAAGDNSGRAQVLGDGPVQSGGRNITVNVETAFSRSLAQIGTDLINQYEIEYTLPQGTKPSDRISVELKKPGLTFRAPTRVPTK